MDSPWRLCAVAASFLALAGCSEQAPKLLTWSPAPVPQRVIVNANAPAAAKPFFGADAAAARTNAAPINAASHAVAAKTALANPIAHNPASVVVQRGETLYDISQRYHVPLRLLLDANRLRPPYGDLVGRRLVLPKPPTHVVQTGQTLYGLSRLYHVGLYELVSANDIQAPYRLDAGAVLVIPPPEGGPPVPPLKTAGPLKTAAPRQSPPAPAPMMVAERRGPPLPQPAPRAAPRHETAPRQAEERKVERPMAARPKATRRMAMRRDSTPRRTAASPPPMPVAEAAAPPGRGHPFLWPVRGRVLVGFGPESNGLNNDGINIAVPEGTPVRAAATGVVVYAGNELKGYGNLLLIRHADGWITAYAHNAKLLVRRGQRVTRGEIIARAGETGGVSSPQLHFEIRHGTQAVDPLRYLSAQAATRGPRAG